MFVFFYSYLLKKESESAFSRPQHNCSERAKFALKSAPIRLYNERGVRRRTGKIRPRSQLCRDLFSLFDLAFSAERKQQII